MSSSEEKQIQSEHWDILLASIFGIVDIYICSIAQLHYTYWIFFFFVISKLNNKSLFLQDQSTESTDTH